MKKDFPAANESLDQLIARSPDYRVFAELLRAHSLFLAGDYSFAATEFTQLVNNLVDYQRAEQAVIRWNAMMAQLATGKNISPADQDWPGNFKVAELEAELGSWWR